MTKIVTAKTAGFCFGVNRAVTLAQGLAAQGKKVATLGPIIHNTHLVEQLKKQGIRPVKDLSEVQPDETVVIRSHGVPAAVYGELKQRCLPYEDATCPFVAKIHRTVAAVPADGVVLIAGDRTHPEVLGITGHCKAPYFVFSDVDELRRQLEAIPDFSKKQVVMVSQTTFHQGKWEKCTEFMKKHYTNAGIFDTICNATVSRQQEAEQLAAENGLMVIVGDRGSSNTAKLYEICSAHTDAVLIEDASELPKELLSGRDFIGITAGASTPAGIIKEVLETMSETVKDFENEEFSFEEELEKSFKTISNGQKVVGTVVGIAPNEIQIDVGTKHAGYVPLHELTDDPNAKAEDLVKKGDELNLVVVRVNDIEGTVQLSKRRYDAIEGFEKVQKAAEENTVIEGTVTEVIKGGVIVSSNGVKIFVPGSQATVSRNEPLEDLLKKKVQLRIIEMGRGRRRPVGSIRNAALDQRKELAEKFWNEVEVGATYTGTVKSLTNYGAFVDIGGVDGMVHVSELSWKRLKHPSEVVKVGDVLTVYVKDFDKEKGRISLGYKKTEDNPFEIFKTTYHVGDIVKGPVVSVTDFGVFVEIMDGVDGLVHISQLSYERVNKVSDVFSVGDVVTAKITGIEDERKRISLSIKETLEAPAKPAEEAKSEEEEIPEINVEGVTIQRADD